MAHLDTGTPTQSQPVRVECQPARPCARHCPRKDGHGAGTWVLCPSSGAPGKMIANVSDMWSTGVGAPPVAASHQRLAAVRDLAGHWAHRGAANALLKAANLEVLPNDGKSSSLMFTQADSAWIAKLSFQDADDMDDRAAVEEFVSRHLAKFAADIPFVMHCVANHTMPGVTALLNGGPLAAPLDHLRDSIFRKVYLLVVGEFVSSHRAELNEDAPLAVHFLEEGEIGDVTTLRLMYESGMALAPSPGGGLTRAHSKPQDVTALLQNGPLAMGFEKWMAAMTSNKVFQTIHSNPTGYLMLSERGTGLTMGDFLNWATQHPKGSQPMQDLEAVSLQLVYCLAAIERLGIAHNDLHLNNILVERLSDKVRFKLCDRPDKARTRSRGSAAPEGFELSLLPTHWMCRLIDWDMALINGLPLAGDVSAPANTGLDTYYPPDACKQAGLCGQPGRDLAMVAYNVWSRLAHIESQTPGLQGVAVAKRWWLKLVPGLRPFLETNKDELVFKGYPCHKAEGACLPVTPPPPSAVSVLRDYANATNMSPTQWWIPAQWQTPVHVCTLPLHTLAHRLSMTHSPTPPPHSLSHSRPARSLDVHTGPRVDPEIRSKQRRPIPA